MLYALHVLLVRFPPWCSSASARRPCESAALTSNPLCAVRDLQLRAPEKAAKAKPKKNTDPVAGIPLCQRCGAARWDCAGSRLVDVCSPPPCVGLAGFVAASAPAALHFLILLSVVAVRPRRLTHSAMIIPIASRSIGNCRVFECQIQPQLLHYLSGSKVGATLDWGVRTKLTSSFMIWFWDCRWCSFVGFRLSFAVGA